MTSLDEYMPKPATWFSKTLNYDGTGRIEFSSPKGWVEGDVICNVSRLGEVHFNLAIKNWANLDNPEDQSLSSRDSLLSGVKIQHGFRPIYPSSVPSENIIMSVELFPLYGGLLTSDKTNYYSWEPLKGIISIDIHVATYIAPNKNKSDAKYWAIPCINFVQRPFGSNPAHLYSDLIRHPLRIFPVSQKTQDFLVSDAPESDRDHVHHYMSASSNIILFSYDGEPAFIERLPNYEQINAELNDGKSEADVTSIIVGNCSKLKDEMKPIHLLRVLGFVTGRPVGGSWIEFHDKNANLAYRIHANFGRFPFGSGRPILYQHIHINGLQSLLSDVSKQSVVSDPEIRGVMLNYSRAVSSHDGSIILYYIFTAFDGLFNYYNDRIDLRLESPIALLSSSQINAIEEILTQAKHEIEKLKLDSATDQEIRAIDKVANNTRSQPLNKSKQFADKLVALMDELGLCDAEILASYYGDYKTWLQKINEFRNTTMHETHYGNVFEEPFRSDFQFLIPHLKDILIRIVLKTIGYTGQYSPYVKMPGHSEEVDWVKPTSSPRDLGYK